MLISRQIYGDAHQCFFLGMLTTLILTHILQHTLFDWLKLTWVPPNHVGLIWIWWIPCEF